MIKRIFLILALFCILAIPVWSLWIGPYFTQLSANFSYQANLLSLDNFYNPKAKKFEGEHISKTRFSYRVITKKKNYLLIENSFSVRTLSNKPIFSVTRLYSIDPYHLSHIKTMYDQRIGYLFGPRFQKKKSFLYWHVNYNSPALMQYANEENIGGLKVYHYIAHYQADQTENLRNLPGVSNKYGIRTFVTLNLWLEPISGWLVKYDDNAIAYFYDNKNGQLVYPWNKFSNRYSPISIEAQVKQATCLKYKTLLLYIGVPVILALLAIIFLNLSFFSRVLKETKISWDLASFYHQNTSSLIIILLILAFFFSLQVIFHPAHERLEYRIGISVWNNNIDFQETVKGFKDELRKLGFIEGGNTTFIIKNANNHIQNQINIIQDFINEKVNLIFTLTTPGTLIAKGITNEIPIVFSEVTYPVETGIIQSTISSKNNLAGTRNYLPAALIFYQLDKLNLNLKTIHYIHRQGDPDDDIQWREYKDLLKDRNINLYDIAFIDTDDLELKLNSLTTDAIILSCASLIQSEAGKIVADFALQKKIPVLTCDKQSMLSGALIAYFADHYTLGEMSGRKAAYILKGAEPQWLFTDTLNEGKLLINPKTAGDLKVKLNGL